jgi:hypothetical protein
MVVVCFAQGMMLQPVLRVDVMEDDNISTKLVTTRPAPIAGTAMGRIPLWQTAKLAKLEMWKDAIPKEKMTENPFYR